VPGISGAGEQVTSVFGAVDVHYPENDAARAALVGYGDARFSEVLTERTVLCAGAEPYRPGEFYRRELPALRAVCVGAGHFTVLVIDGYVDLAPAGRPGLGYYVYEEFGVPVVGVAKNPFHAAVHAAKVIRGRSRRPLYVTAAGWALPDAAAMIGEMAGSFRIPDALRRVDRLARGLDVPR
jgi:deoxyribonuclease V